MEGSYGPSYSGCDGNWGGGGLPPIVLHGANEEIIVCVFVCEGLVRVSVVAICEFNELDCECVRVHSCTSNQRLLDLLKS